MFLLSQTTLWIVIMVHLEDHSSHMLEYSELKKNHLGIAWCRADKSSSAVYARGGGVVWICL